MKGIFLRNTLLKYELQCIHYTDRFKVRKNVTCLLNWGKGCKRKFHLISLISYYLISPDDFFKKIFFSPLSDEFSKPTPMHYTPPPVKARNMMMGPLLFVIIIKTLFWSTTVIVPCMSSSSQPSSHTTQTHTLSLSLLSV